MSGQRNPGDLGERDRGTHGDVRKRGLASGVVGFAQTRTGLDQRILLALGQTHGEMGTGHRRGIAIAPRRGEDLPPDGDAGLGIAGGQQ